MFFSRVDIDKVNKDKKLQDFWVEVFFEDYQPAETEELKVGSLSPALSHSREDVRSLSPAFGLCILRSLLW